MIPPTREAPKVKPYYSDGGVTIYHGDCLELLPLVGKVDLVVTSPPYNLGTTNGGPSGMHAGSLAASDLSGGYRDYDDARPQDEYNAWQTEVVHALYDNLTDAGAIFYNHKPRPQGGSVILPTIYGIGLPLRQVVVWDRGTGLNFSRSHFLPKCEWILIWARLEWRLVSRETSGLGDVWTFPPETAPDHPAPFPLGLPLRAIGSTTAQVVLDPFMGSGTTLRAAKDLGRKAIGIDVSERYCEIAAKRLAQEVLDFGGSA